MRIGSLKLGERIIKDEKMVVCQKLFQAAYLPLWRIALLLFHLLYNCFPVFLNITGSLKRLIPALLYFMPNLQPMEHRQLADILATF